MVAVVAVSVVVEEDPLQCSRVQVATLHVHPLHAGSVVRHAGVYSHECDCTNLYISHSDGCHILHAFVDIGYYAFEIIGEFYLIEFPVLLWYIRTKVMAMDRQGLNRRQCMLNMLKSTWYAGMVLFM